MPLLEFECNACGVRFEELVSGSVLPACPECGDSAPRRLYSPVSPPRRIGMSPIAMRDSDLRRGEREAKRQEGFAEQRKQRARDKG